MSLEKQLREELDRYNSINNYQKKSINEQEELDPTDLPTGDEPVGDAPIGDEPVGDAPVDDLPVDDAPVDEIPAEEPEGDFDTEEIDITDLVNMTQNIKNDLDSSKSDNDAVMGKMGDLFGKLDDLESKLSQMDDVIAKIDGLESKVTQMKEPTPQEKLEMRSLDSYPFNQSPTDFFSQKQGEMKKSGKNEYVITKSDLDEITLLSHQRAENAWNKGFYDKSVIPISYNDGKDVLKKDALIKPDITIEKLAQLKPFFEAQGKLGYDAMMLNHYPYLDKIKHLHSIANCPGMADGASLILLGTKEAGDKIGLKPRARIVDFTETADNPIMQLTAGFKAMEKLLNNQKKPNRLIIFATHNRFFADKADCLLEITDGSVKTINV